MSKSTESRKRGKVKTQGNVASENTTSKYSLEVYDALEWNDGWMLDMIQYETYQNLALACDGLGVSVCYFTEIIFVRVSPNVACADSGRVAPARAVSRLTVRLYTHTSARSNTTSDDRVTLYSMIIIVLTPMSNRSMIYSLNK